MDETVDRVLWGLESGVNAVLHRGYGLTKARIRLATPAQKAGQFFTPLMLNFCRVYGKWTQRERIPMGFGSGAVGMIFEHSCPNNAPVILWSNSQKYAALFPNRGIPVELKSAFYGEDINRPSNVLWDSSQYRLALAMLRDPTLERGQGSQWKLLLALGLASRSGWEDVKIAGVLGVPVAEVTARSGLRRIASGCWMYKHIR